MAEAGKRGNNPRYCHWEELHDGKGFGPGRVFGHEADTVIIESLPLDVLLGGPISPGKIFFNKLIKEDQIEIAVKHRNDRTVPIPFLIFTVLTPPYPPESLSELCSDAGPYHRIQLVHLSKVAA